MISRRSVLAQAAVSGLVLPGFVRAGTNLEGTRDRKIKIGQIGVGHAHANKLIQYRQSPFYEVVGIVEPDEELRQSAQKQPVYRDLPWMTRQQLLETPGLEAVLVESRVKDLLDHAHAAADAGKHIHLDKPAGNDWTKFRSLIAKMREKSLLLQMGYMYRYNPAFVLLRKFLDNGLLGRIFEIHAVMSKVVEPKARLEHGVFSGGMMFELGCHLIDLVVAILGKPDRVQGYGRHSSPIQDPLVDNMLAVLEYPKALATVKTSALEIDGGSRRHLVVCGTEGTFHIQPLDNPRVRLTLDRARSGYPKGTQEIDFPKFERYKADASDMARLLSKHPPAPDSFPLSLDHDLAVQETVLRASGMPLDGKP